MKKLFTLVAALLLAVSVWAQNCPQKISYQAVVRNAANELVTNQSGIRVSIKITDGSGRFYQETHQDLSTNQNGLLSLVVGEGIPANASTSLGNIDWPNATMKTSVTIPGEDVPVEATTPVMAVPYALYSCEINPGSQTITNIYTHIEDTLNNYYTKSETKVQIASDIHDSIVNNISTQIHDTVMNHLNEYDIKNCNDVQNCVASQIKDSLNFRFVNYFNKFETKAEISNTIHDSIVNNISTQIHDTVTNHLNEYKIKDCDDVVACTIIKNMRDSIQLNRDTIRTIVANLRDTINKTVLDSIKYYNSEMNLAIDTIVKNIVHDSIVNNISKQISDSLVNYLTIDGLCDSIKHNCSVAFTDERNVFTKRNRFQKVVILEKGAVQSDGTIGENDTLNSVNGKDLVKYTGNVIHDSIVNNISKQISDTVTNHLNEYVIKDCDDVVACTIIKNMRDSIQINRASISNNYNRIQTNITNIQSNRDTIRTIVANLRDTINKTVLDSIKYYNSEMNLAIDTIVKNIVHDSIVNNISKQISDTVTNHLSEYVIKNCNDVQGCVAPQIKDSLVNYLTIDGLCDSIKNNCSVAFTDVRNVFTKRNRFQKVVILEKGAVQSDGTIGESDSLNSVNGKDLVNYTGKVIHDSIVNNISKQISDTVMNHLNEYEIKNCEDVNKCVVEGLRTQNTTINNVVDSLVMKNVLDSISVNSSKLNNAIDTIVDNRAAKQWMDMYNVSEAEQVTFSISKTPKANTLVKMYINGVMVGGYTAGMTNTVITVSEKTVTYVPANNPDACGTAYKLKAGDRVAFEYWY